MTIYMLDDFYLHDLTYIKLTAVACQVLEISVERLSTHEVLHFEISDGENIYY